MEEKTLYDMLTETHAVWIPDAEGMNPQGALYKSNMKEKTLYDMLTETHAVWIPDAEGMNPQGALYKSNTERTISFRNFVFDVCI